MADTKLVDITCLERFLDNIQPLLDKAESAVQSVKTINGQSIIGEGNINISGGEGGTSYDDTELRSLLDTKANIEYVDNALTDSINWSNIHNKPNIFQLEYQPNLKIAV